MERRRGVVAIGLVLWLAVSASVALADPAIEPPISAAGKPQSFTLAIPDEHQPNADLTKVELYPPPGLRITSFSDHDDWNRDWTIVSGTNGVVQKATWTRVGAAEKDPFYAPDASPSTNVAEDADGVVRFRFVAVPAAKTSYPVEVRETFSTGKVLHWTPPGGVAFPQSPPGTEFRDPIVLEAESGPRYVWIAGGAAAAIAAAIAVTLGVRARRRAVRPS